MQSYNNSLIKRILFALFAGIILAVLIVLSSEEASKSAIIMGDFPAFYSLAQIAASDDTSRLYDLNQQTLIQNSNWPSLEGGVLIAVYPPALALVLSPIGKLEAAKAHIIYSLLSVTALSLSLAICISNLRKHQFSRLTVIAFVVCNPLILIGTLGGQNTAFSLLIIAVSLYLLNKSIITLNSYYEFLSGITFSLWLFKPQYGLAIFPFLFVFKLRRACFGFLLGSTAHYLAGVYLLGWNWPSIWLKSISDFAKINYTSNQDIHTSLLSLINLINSNINLVGIELASIITWIAFPLLTILVCLFLKYNAATCKSKDILADAILIFIGSFPLLIPQAQFYDIGIAIFCYTYLALRQKVFPVVQALSLLFLSWIFILLRQQAGYLLFPVLSVLFLISIIKLSSVFKTKNQA